MKTIVPSRMALVVSIICFVLFGSAGSGLAADSFTLDGITFNSTPTIRTYNDVSNSIFTLMSRPGVNQSIADGRFSDIYFRTSTGQFGLGLYDDSYKELAVFDSPASGSGFTCTTGEVICAFGSLSLSEGPAGRLIQATSTSGTYDNRAPFLKDGVVSFTAYPGTTASKWTRGKYHSSGLILGVIGDSCIAGGGVDGDGLVAFRLTGTAPDYSGAVTGAVQALPNYGSSGKPPGLAITPNSRIMVSSTTNGAFQIYSYSGMQLGSEAGTYSLTQSGNLNTLTGLSGVDSVKAASALAFGVNKKNDIILAVVDNNNTTLVTDDRVYFFAQKRLSGLLFMVK